MGINIEKLVLLTFEAPSARRWNHVIQAATRRAEARSVIARLADCTNGTLVGERRVVEATTRTGHIQASVPRLKSGSRVTSPCGAGQGPTVDQPTASLLGRFASLRSRRRPGLPALSTITLYRGAPV